MKSASKILSIIACVIGILWSIIGFFTVAIGAGMMSAAAKINEQQGKADQIENSGASVALALVGALIMMVLGMIFSAVGNAEGAGKHKSIIHGALLLLCGIFATGWHSYVAGPIYIISGILTIIAGAGAQNSNPR